MTRGIQLGFVVLAGIVSAGMATVDGCLTTLPGSSDRYRVRIASADSLTDPLAAEVVDGWRIEFARALVVIGDVSVQYITSTSDETLVDAPAYRVYDLTTATGSTGVIVAEDDVNDLSRFKRLNNAFRVAPDPDATAANAAETDVEFMTSNGYSVYFELTATKDNVTKSFALGFDRNFGSCFGSEISAERPFDAVGEFNAEGLFVQFTNGVASPDIQRFVMADADDDGEVTAAELAAVDSGTNNRTLLQLLEGRISSINPGACAVP
ncbi:MAG: hypothetical protein KDA33_12030 [Phycisphaerales bacterium]|nr:hypothetical protein [Phycisphaerales bacterium]